MAATILMAAQRGAGAAPARAEVAGIVRLTLPGGRIAPAADAVVWVGGALRPGPRSRAQPPAITSRDKRFDPHVLVVTRGTAVAFPNVDSIFHNAFSRTPGSEFDLGLYRRGASRAFTFRNAGLVHLYCNIHSEMAADVLVLDPDDAFALADESGAFRLPDVPAGAQVLHVWSEKGGEKDVTVDVGGASAPLDVTLDASAYRALTHKNKFGRDYPPATQGVDRY
ncbi:MAG TPA: carboxypeptidase regulatory-like domain-containing protein [Vicinamibacteria bacterium]|nr:carboxypeptidase regulatory-like domain-containing protein [Vicinamibacteria bacterium]